MKQEVLHPDLLALAEGRLSAEDRRSAQAHMADCAACRKDYQELSQSLGVIEKVAKEARSAFAQPGELEREADQVLDKPVGEALFSLSRDDMTYTLPPDLQKRLDPKPGLAERLSHAAQTLGGLGKEAAQALGERILNGGAEPMGAPAVRKDATEVEDEEPAEETKRAEADKPEE